MNDDFGAADMLTSILTSPGLPTIKALPLPNTRPYQRGLSLDVVL